MLDIKSITKKPKYLFSWDDIQVDSNNSNSREFMEFFEILFADSSKYKKNLEKKLNDVFKSETNAFSTNNLKIEKSIDGKTIIVYNKINWNNLSLVLKNEKTKVHLEIGAVNMNEFIAKEEDGKLNIYKINNSILKQRIERIFSLNHLIDVDHKLLLIARTLLFALFASFVISKLSTLFFTHLENNIFVSGFTTYGTSAQYILSALAQSQAAIIAIVFSAFLIIVQMSVGLNSKTAVFEAFLKSKNVIILISLYAYSIGYDLVLLALITKDTIEVNVFVPIVLMIILILFLVPSIISMVHLINKQVIAGEARMGHHKYLNNFEFEGAFLSKAKLDHAKLIDAKLHEADLQNADLRAADMTNIELFSAKLNNADLRGADLKNARMDKCDLTLADLRGSSLAYVNLIRADMINVKLNGASLPFSKLNDNIIINCRLEGVDIPYAELNRVKFIKSNLNGANLPNAQLKGAILKDIKLNGASLEGANLVGADLRNAVFNGADLSNADLSNAQLEGTKMYGAEVYGATFDSNTNFEKLGLCRDNVTKLHSKCPHSVDRDCADFRGANLGQKFSYPGSKFEKAIFCHANLVESNLSGCSLKKTNMIGTNLSRSQLNGANLTEADLRRAHLKKTKLNGANLNLVILSGADLSEAYLDGAILDDAIMCSTDSNGLGMDGFKLLKNNILYKTNLKGTNLRKVELNGAKLENAKLMGADLSGATLTGASLKGADLRGADLQGTDFSGANLWGADLRDTKQDDKTNFSGALLSSANDSKLGENLIN